MHAYLIDGSSSMSLFFRNMMPIGCPLASMTIPPLSPGIWLSANEAADTRNVAPHDWIEVPCAG